MVGWSELRQKIMVKEFWDKIYFHKGMHPVTYFLQIYSAMNSSMDQSINHVEVFII
jgi:hypothetical protein